MSSCSSMPLFAHAICLSLSLSLKAFLNTRRICISSCCSNLRRLYKDFPTSSPSARLVILLTLFYSCVVAYNPNASASSTQATLQSNSGSSVQSSVSLALDNSVSLFASTNLKEQLLQVGLKPSRSDIINVLLHPLIEKPLPVLTYWRDVLLEEEEENVDERIKELAEEVAVRCLPFGFKGKTLRKLCETFSLTSTIAQAALRGYKIVEDKLPSWENEAQCWGYSAELARDYGDMKVKYITVDDDKDRVGAPEDIEEDNTLAHVDEADNIEGKGDVDQVHPLHQFPAQTNIHPSLRMKLVSNRSLI
jgi:hypothetical protein